MLKNIFLLAFILLIKTASSLTYNLQIPSYSAFQFIASRPSESSFSVGDLCKYYQALEQRWIGSSNAKENHLFLQKSNLFAAKNLTESICLVDERKVTMKRVVYDTAFQNTTHHVSGLIIFPPKETPPKGVILYFHSTTAGKLRVPSLNFADAHAQLQAATFASHGYIVMAPDYIGLGEDFKSEHPYILYPQANVEDGKNLLLSGVKILESNGINFDKQIPLFVAGYSEGGSYALWFARIYQNNKIFRNQLKRAGYQIRKVVPVEGAYDISGVMFPFLLDNQVSESSNIYGINTAVIGTILKPLFAANTLIAYSVYDNVPIEKLLNMGFYNLDCSSGLPICDKADSALDYNLNNVRLIDANTFKMALKYYFAALGLSGRATFSYGIFSNSIKPLLNPQAINNPNLWQTARNADVDNWKNMIPVTLISLRNDSLVPELNSANAFNGMLAQKSQNLKYIQLNNDYLKARTIWGPSVVDHASFEVYALLMMLQEFEAH